jgi:hypothetical protein
LWASIEWKGHSLLKVPVCSSLCGKQSTDAQGAAGQDRGTHKQRGKQNVFWLLVQCLCVQFQHTRDAC